MKAADLDILLQEGEGVMLEYKESLSSSFARELVALANTAGGRILLGVRDDGTIKGIADTNQLRARIQDIARNCDPPVKILVRRIRGEAHVQGCPEPLFEETGFVTATFFPNPEVRTQAGGRAVGRSLRTSRHQVGTMMRPMIRPMSRWNPRHEDPGQVTGQVAVQVCAEVLKMLELMEGEMTRIEIQAALGLKGRANFEERYLKPAMEMGLVDMTRPDKLRSSKQKYRITPAGRAILENAEKERQS